MHLLEDILRVLGVAGREAEKILSDMHDLADSRGARKLVVQLPKKAREELDEQLEKAVPGKQAEIIQSAIQNTCSEQDRGRAYEEALGEVIQEVFLPTVLQEATPAQRLEIERLISL